MDAFAQDLISLLQYLLPGFLAAWIFYGLTSYEKPSQFERVIQALILTLIIEALVRVKIAALSGASADVEAFLRSDDGRLYLSIMTALLVGVLFAYFANRDVLHRLVRRFGLTRETSFPSEWFGAFLQNVTYVVLHMKDERRLYGWPREWPSTPDKGHFVIEQPSWIVDERETPITGVKSVLMPVEEVLWVEFLNKTWENRNG